MDAWVSLFAMIYDSLRCMSAYDFNMQRKYVKSYTSNSVKLAVGTLIVLPTYIFLNVQVLLVPSAFTKITGQAHWEILLRARAIETQCYVRT